MIKMPSYAPVQANGRVAFVELRPIDADTFHAVLHNGGAGSGVALDKVTGTTPSGLPYMEVNQATGPALGIDQHGDDVVVGCASSGTYRVAHKA